MFVKLEISLLLPKLLTGRLFSKYVCFFFSRCRCSQMFYKKPVVLPTTLVKHGYQHSCFLMNVVKIFKIAFFKKRQLATASYFRRDSCFHWESSANSLSLLFNVNSKVHHGTSKWNIADLFLANYS